MCISTAIAGHKEGTSLRGMLRERKKINFESDFALNDSPKRKKK